MRREFQLPARDVEFLTAEGYQWETIGKPGGGYVLIPGFLVPEGYNFNVATVALKISATYDDSQIDMAYFFPVIARLDGKPIHAASGTTIDGKNYQQWSRHRTAENPWRPGVDYIGTHLGQVKAWLEKELLR